VTHIQALIDAFGLGAVYALIAVGIGLVFGVLRLVNFAYGQLIMIGAYMLVFTDGWPDAASVLVAVATAVVASLVMERVAFRPLRTASPATMLVATFAISFLLQNVALLRYTYRNRPVGDSVGTLGELNQAVTIGSLHIRWVTFLAIGVTAVALGALALLLTTTSLGLQMRAAAEHNEAAFLSGINIRLISQIAWATGTVLAFVGGFVLANTGGVVNVQLAGLGLLAFPAVVIGGLESIPGSVIGGVLVGVLEVMIGGYVDVRAQQPVVYAALLAMLLVRPYGLFGQRDIVRV
jgi:branched-chain amino acid transport system permease protein